MNCIVADVRQRGVCEYRGTVIPIYRCINLLQLRIGGGLNNVNSFRYLNN